MRTRQLGLAPASVPAKKVKKSDAVGLAAYEAEQQQAFDRGKQTVEALQQHAAGAKTADFQKILAELSLGKKQTAKLSKRFSLQLVHCNRCYAGQFVVKQLLGQGKQLKQTDFSTTELHSEFVRSASQ
jgi:7-cyano-7-deazaguanine synthase in queuosine biosynthesis